MSDVGSPPEERPSDKDDECIDMAALLLAALFYKQVVPEGKGRGQRDEL
jgi:hypothetical protein